MPRRAARRRAARRRALAQLLLIQCCVGVARAPCRRLVHPILLLLLLLQLAGDTSQTPVYLLLCRSSSVGNLEPYFRVCPAPYRVYVRHVFVRLVSPGRVRATAVQSVSCV